MKMDGYCVQCKGDDPDKPLVEFDKRMESFEKGKFLVHCSGCGITEVDADAKCVFKYCEKKHGLSRS